MFTRSDGPLALVTVIRALVRGDLTMLEATSRAESLRGDVQRLLESPDSLGSKIEAVLYDYEATIPLIIPSGPPA